MIPFLAAFGCGGPAEQPGVVDVPILQAPATSCIGELCGLGQVNGPATLLSRDTGEEPFFAENVLVSNGYIGFMKPIEGGVQLPGYEWRGPVSGVQYLVDDAYRGGGPVHAQGKYEEDGFHAGAYPWVLIYEESDWSRPALKFYEDCQAGQSAGDMNNDGVDDIAYVTYWGCEIPEEGRAIIVDGSDRGEIPQTDAWAARLAEITDWSEDDGGGYTQVTASHDLNGDGVQDLLLSGYTEYSYLYFGPVTTDGSSADADLRLDWGGASRDVEVTPDMNGDGVADILSTGVRTAFIAAIDASEQSASLSEFACDLNLSGGDGVPDIDSDGVHEVAFSTYRLYGQGEPIDEAVWLVRGGRPGVSDCSESGVLISTGHVVTREVAVSDLDIDGFGELLLSSTFEEQYAIAVVSFTDLGEFP